MITHTIRLFPTSEQVDKLNQLSTLRNDLWNTLLRIEENEFETKGEIIHNYGLDKIITELKSGSENKFLLNAKACQRISKEIFTSYKSFLVLIKKNKSAKPPKEIENISKFHTIIFNQNGWSFKGGKFYINKIAFEFKGKDDYSNLNIKEIRVKFKNNKWLCDLSIQENIEFKENLIQKNKILAIDLGLKRLGTGIDTEGNYLIIDNKAKKISKYYLKQIAKIQTKQSKCTKYSNRFNKLQKVKNNLYCKKNSKIKQTLHIQSNTILNMNYHTIVLGDLSVKKLMEIEGNKYSKVSKSFGMSNISTFVEYLKYKSFKHQTNIVKVNEQYTTQTNSLTGKQFLNKIELNDRQVKLDSTTIIDRDLNASINILDRYFDNCLASVTKPLDKTDVIQKFNLLNKPAQMSKAIMI